MASTLEAIGKMGFEAVEISLMEPGDIKGGKMRGELTRRGLTCSSVAVICGEGRDLRGTAEEQRGALENALNPVRLDKGINIAVGIRQQENP